MTTFDPTDGVSLAELIRLIRMRTGDFPQKRRKTQDGDAEQTDFFLSENVYDTPVATVAGTVTSITFDADTGWATFATAPSGEIIFTYSDVTWSNERIKESINASIDELFGKFYVVGDNDALVTDGTGELLVETATGDDLGPEDRIRKVEYWNGSRWTRWDSWSVGQHDGAKYIVWENSPASGVTIRVSYAVRPGNLALDAETLEGTAGLPTRAKECVIMYTISSLLLDRMHRRIRDGRGHNTQDENAVKSYEIQNDAQFLRAQAELLARSLKMDTLPTRIVF